MREDAAGAPIDTLRLGGALRYEPPVLLFGNEVPFFGLVSDNAVRVYEWAQAGPVGRYVGDRDWVLYADPATAPGDPDFPPYDEGWAGGAFALSAFRGEALPGWITSFGQGSPSGGRELVTDTLRASTVTLDRDRFEVEATWTRHSGSGSGAGTFRTTVAGSFHQAGSLFVFSPDQVASTCSGLAFGILDGDSLRLDQLCVGVVVADPGPVTFERAP